MADNNTNELDALMISELPTQATANETDLFEVAIVDANSASGYASKKESAAAIADAIVGQYQYPLRITGTTAKTIAGAINELKNLVDLLPQFAIEVVQTLPVSDISETTIYLVPAQDPEQGNYYEEYIYVNNAWELVGTTAVDLSGYYTSAQVDTLLAAKANTSSLATVATSGAYSDLSGKPTIDTALDTTSTNAVENRAVASEINSIKSDITVEGSASGDIATFVDGSDNPLKELKISIEAVQDLHGQSNPYPAGGGKNKYSGSSTVTKDDSAILVSEQLSAVLLAGTYTMSALVTLNTGVTSARVAFRRQDGTGITAQALSAGSGQRTSFTVTLSEDAYLIYFYGTSDTITKASATFADIQIEAGSTATAYAPYANICPISGWTGANVYVSGEDTSNPTTYNINWQSTAGTVYGGTLDVLTGELTVTHSIIDLGDLSWVYTTMFYAYSPSNSFAPTSSDLTKKLICSCYKVVSGSAPSNPDKMITMNNSSTGSSRVIRVYDTDYTDATTFKTAVTGQKIVYELATPVTYQLTPTEVRSLLGLNNVFADCGAITELKYTRDLNLCINDIIARIEALEGGSNTRSLSVSPVLTKLLTSELDTAEGKTEETEEEAKEEAQKNER